jgi:phospholipid/cholesterol/gamma-HCH transport system substrate-binding protein
MKMTNEIKIGIMVFICLMALIILTLKVGNFSFYKKGYEIKVKFRNISGVELNAPVHLNGLEVGLVKDIQIAYEDVTKMVATLWIEGDVKIHKSAKAYVMTMGMIGQKYIGILDEAKGDYLHPGGLIIGEEPIELERLLAKGENIATSLESASKNIDEFSNDIKRHPWKLLFRTREKNR